MISGITMAIICAALMTSATLFISFTTKTNQLHNTTFPVQGVAA